MGFPLPAPPPYRRPCGAAAILQLHPSKRTRADMHSKRLVSVDVPPATRPSVRPSVDSLHIGMRVCRVSAMSVQTVPGAVIRRGVIAGGDLGEERVCCCRRTVTGAARAWRLPHQPPHLSPHTQAGCCSVSGAVSVSGALSVSGAVSVLYPGESRLCIRGNLGSLPLKIFI